jgi:cytochrome c oxidase subunit III
MPELAHSSENKIDYTGSKLGMWLFLFTEILLFGGLFLLYAVYRSQYAPDFHGAAQGLSTAFGAINTILLLTSSLTMALSIVALRQGKKNFSMVFQTITILFGLAFLVNKYFEWSGHIHEGLYPNAPELLSRSHGEILFYGLYYVMTGLHGIHVVIGMVAIAVVLWFTIRGAVSSENFNKLENAGLYWHLVDIIWIYLFPLFYLIT